MGAVLKYRNDDGDLEVVDNLPSEGWEVKEGAEEGSSESSTITIPDPEGALNFVPHRRIIIYENTSEDANEILFSGFVTSDDLGRENGEHAEFTGESGVISLTVNDMNTLFDQRVMVGETKRGDESDVVRVTWVAESEEMGYFDNLDFLFAGDTATLEKRDVAGQTPKQLFDEAAQDTDKNYWIGATGTSGEVGADNFLWYGKASRSDYASSLSLTNDPTELDAAEADMADGTSLVWPISEDTQRKRTGERIYSGVLVEYEGGRVYRSSATTKAAYTLSGRDLVHPAPEIKSSARAVRRANKLLARLDEPTITVTTRVRLPAAKATMLRAGMTVPITATHIPELATATTCRILNASIKPVQAGRYYDITIEAEPISAAVGGSCSTVIGATSSVSDTGPGSSEPTVDITPADNTILIAWLTGANQNSSGATDMTAITGYTELLDVPSVSKSTYRIATKSGSAGVPSTADATYDAGFPGDIGGYWMGMQLAIGLSSATPVQSKYAANAFSLTLDAPPSAGNIVLVFAHLDSGWGLLPNVDINRGPIDNWLELFNRDYDPPGGTRLNMAIFARCATAGETGEYAFSQTKVGYSTARSVFVAEFAP